MKIWLCNLKDVLNSKVYNYPVLVIRSKNIKRLYKIKKMIKCGFVRTNNKTKISYYVAIQRLSLLKWIYFFRNKSFSKVLIHTYNQVYQVNLK